MGVWPSRRESLDYAQIGESDSYLHETRRQHPALSARLWTRSLAVA